MAKGFVKMATKGNLLEKSREARRRRIEMRRLSAPVLLQSTAGPVRYEMSPYRSDRPREGRRGRASRSHSQSPLRSIDPTEDSEAAPYPTGTFSPSDPLPKFGSMSITGRSREMEDAISLQPNFFRPGVPGQRPLHFFGVFDGHGGSHVALICREKMHVFLAEELERVPDSCEELEGWKGVMERCFGRMDEVALSACTCGRVGVACDCERAGGIDLEIVGSTATIAVVNSSSIVVANCGDSRAVLSRGGRAIPLSHDHKPDRPDELERIEAAGGRVIYLNGARVLGILAMSRALGDKYFKPVVISTPEVKMIERSPDDECLILASDGLWDVLSNDMACKVACRCLHEGSPSTTATESVSASKTNAANEDKEMQALESPCSLAAALLTRLALGRRSSDNISVIVVDLKRCE